VDGLRLAAAATPRRGGSAAAGHGARLCGRGPIQNSSGVVGCIQATEAIKLIRSIGETPTAWCMRYSDGHDFKEYKLSRASTCRVCDDNLTLTERIDY
jgi:hypothetical protein